MKEKTLTWLWCDLIIGNIQQKHLGGMQKWEQPVKKEA
jgi:hypothetical protein